MFGSGRRRTPGDIARTELDESLEHFTQAALHAAAGVSAVVGPRFNAARGHLAPTAAKVRNTASDGWESTRIAIAPLAAAALDSARRSPVAQKVRSREMRNMKAMRMPMMPTAMRGRRARKRWPRLAGMLAAGAAVGAIGAMAMRRRRQQQWEEFEPGRAMSVPEGMEPVIGSSPAEAIRATAGPTAAGSATAMDKMATGSAKATDERP